MNVEINALLQEVDSKLSSFSITDKARGSISRLLKVEWMSSLTRNPNVHFFKRLIIVNGKDEERKEISKIISESFNKVANLDEYKIIFLTLSQWNRHQWSPGSSALRHPFPCLFL